MPATSTDRLYGLTTSVAVKPAVDISADVHVQLYGEQTITTSTATGTHTLTTTEGDRILLTAQENALDNGIWISKPSTWVRAPDFDGPRDAINGTLVFSVNGDCWQVEATDPVIIGDTEIQFRSTYPFSDSLNTLQRTIRVPETTLNELPAIGGRVGKYITFDSAGQVTMVDADDITADEAAARQAADEDLQTNIDSEALARESADTVLQNNINTEAAAREAGDDAEATARQEAIASLQDQLTGNVPLEASAFSVISWHAQEVSNSVSIPENVNAWSFGPTLTIADGQSVDVGDGSFWTIANGLQYVENGDTTDYGELTA